MNRPSQVVLDHIKSSWRYDPDTGDLFWLPRPEEAFKSKYACDLWNRKFANQVVVSNHNVAIENHKKTTLSYLEDISRGPRPNIQRRLLYLYFPRVIFWLQEETWIYEMRAIEYIDGDFMNTSWDNLTT